MSWFCRINYGLAYKSWIRLGRRALNPLSDFNILTKRCFPCVVVWSRIQMFRTTWVHVFWVQLPTDHTIHCMCFHHISVHLLHLYQTQTQSAPKKYFNNMTSWSWSPLHNCPDDINPNPTGNDESFCRHDFFMSAWLSKVGEVKFHSILNRKVKSRSSGSAVDDSPSYCHSQCVCACVYFQDM